MSAYDFRVSSELVAQRPSLAGLLMAAMREADPVSLELLKRNWPQLWAELQERHTARPVPEERT